MNIFKVLDLKTEKYHNKMLYFLFKEEPNFIDGFFHLLKIPNQQVHLIQPEVKLEDSDDASRPDIIVNTKSQYIGIENKISNSSISEEQLLKHSKLIKQEAEKYKLKPLFVLITPNNLYNQKIKEIIKDKQIINIQWDNIIDLLIKYEKSSEGDEMIIKDYVSFLKEEVLRKMKKELPSYKQGFEYLSKAWQLLFDKKDEEFVMERYLELLKDEFNNVLDSKGYISENYKIDIDNREPSLASLEIIPKSFLEKKKGKISEVGLCMVYDFIKERFIFGMHLGKFYSKIIKHVGEIESQLKEKTGNAKIEFCKEEAGEGVTEVRFGYNLFHFGNKKIYEFESWDLLTQFIIENSLPYLEVVSPIIGDLAK